jgi:sec-independent protein translocase protein TatC
MTLMAHLQELRARLFKSILAIAAGAVAGYFLYPQIFTVLKRPYCSVPAIHRVGGARCQLFQFSVFEGFTVRLHIALLAGAIVASPVWLYQIWAFITPALKRNERRFAITFVACSLLLFGSGATLAYLMLPRSLHFLLSVGGGGVASLIGISRYLSFVTLVLIVFGVSLEFPLVVVMLNFAGILSSARLKSWRRMEIFLVFVFAAVITPDPTMLMMVVLAVTMCLLYEAAVLVASIHDKRRAAIASQFAGLDPDQPSPLDLRPSDVTG